MELTTGSTGSIVSKHYWEFAMSLKFRKDLTGNKYGRLTVIKFIERPDVNVSYWECLCDCGNKVTVKSDHLVSGKIQSCKCLHKEITSKIKTKHGMTKTRIYRIWRNMLNRCFYKNYTEFYLYGGRGITVCDRWRYSFENFLKDMGVPNDNLSIDRINVNGNYEPSNCKWSTAKEQANNRRKNAKTY